jgi:hypothetical protein
VDHRTAVSRNLVERYVLGELSLEEEAEGEEHFFACPLCAEDIRYASRLVANLKAEGRGRILLHPGEDSVTVTIHLKTPITSPVECECRCGGNPATLVITALPKAGLIRLRLPAAAVSAGPGIIIVRDVQSKTELQRHQLIFE